MTPTSGSPVEGKTVGATTEPVVLRQFGFIPALDGLRGIAVLLVVAVHFRRIIDPRTTGWIFRPALARYFQSNGGLAHDGWLLIDKPNKSVIAQIVPMGGFLGVDIFFVLSGFLITSLLLREQLSTGRVRFGGFYSRRALRLLPALFAFVIAHVIYASTLHVPTGIERSSIISVLLYYFNWHLIDSFPVVPVALTHLWSLSIEEQFYWVWPLAVVLLLGARRRLSTVVLMLVGSILAVAIWRAFLLRHAEPASIYLRTDARADALLVGALLAHLWVRGIVPPKRFLVVAAWISVAFMTVCLYTLTSTSGFLYYGGFTIIALAVGAIMFATLETDWHANKVLHLRPLRAVGRVAYGLYLWHPLGFAIATQHMRTASAGARIFVGLALPTAFTLISWYVVERPFLKLKDRMELRRTGQQAERDAAASASTTN
jgi:peptidoglycan/LPS O-acetylase OafA/YrhL